MSNSLVGTRIREARKGQKISQAALAAKVGISASYLNLIEHNRRRIAGKTLNALAEALKINANALSESADGELLNQLQQAAERFPDPNAETQRVIDFVGRFPGYAELLRTLFEQNELQRENLLAMSDKLANDPYFAEAIHLMLSSVTTIRSTADLLRQFDEMSPALAARFISNLNEESARLSKTASDVLDYFEPEEEVAVPTIQKIEALSAESSSSDAPAQRRRIVVDENDPLSVAHVEDRLKTLREQVAQNAFDAAAFDCNFEPEEIAQQLNLPLQDVLVRLAHCPDAADRPKFGYLEIDGAGGVLARKRLPSFSLPRNSSGCPLWPVYRSFSQPLAPVKTMMDMPTGERFLGYAVSYFQTLPTTHSPGILNAAMLFTTDYGAILDKGHVSALQTVPIGVQCAVCQRQNCTARRASNILSQ